MNSPIDDLIDQLDIDVGNTISMNICCNCFSINQLYQISCSHYVCITCIENLIKTNAHTQCPQCSSPLTKDLCKIFSDFIKDPVSKLAYYYNINKGDVLWYYEGNTNNWLYTKDHCDKINNVYKSADSVELQIPSSMSTQTYIIDTYENVQYPKHSPHKQRSIGFFTYNSIADLKKHKIIGVSGKLL